MGTAQHKGVELARPVYIIGIGPLAREETEILLAPHSNADTKIAHEPTLQLFRFGERVRLPSSHS
jgi:hypothetical protein